MLSQSQVQALDRAGVADLATAVAAKATALAGRLAAAATYTDVRLPNAAHELNRIDGQLDTVAAG